MGTNDLVYKISARAKELADRPIEHLRLLASESDAPTPSSLKQEFRGHTFGQLLDIILTNEFLEVES